MAKNRNHWWLVVRKMGDGGFCSAWLTRAKARIHCKRITPPWQYKVIKVVRENRR